MAINTKSGQKVSGSIYQARPNKPAHLSVGAIVYDSKRDKILVQKVKDVGTQRGYITLMTETVNPEEDVLDALSRGLKEEAGVTGQVISYIGAQKSNDKWFGEIDKEVRS